MPFADRSTDRILSASVPHCDLDIWCTNLKIHRVNARGTVYIPGRFRRNSLKNKRDICTTDLKIAEWAFSILCLSDLDLCPSNPKMYTALLQVIIYHLAKFEKDRIINGREIV